MNLLLQKADPEEYFVHCKQLLSKIEQGELLKEIGLIFQHALPLYENKTGQGGYKQTSKYVQLFNLHLSDGSLESNNKKIGKKEITTINVPDIFVKSTLESLHHAASLNEKIKVSFYKPGLCEFILYDKDGFVEEHCDCINGWVIVIR